MKSYPYVPSMVHAITVLTVLKMMTKAQTSCGSGSMNGRVFYERLPNIQLQGYDDDVLRDTMPPFKVLEKCEDLCLKDRSTNNIVRTCTSFDFQPGSRIAAFNGGPEYEESTCYLSAESARPEGIGSLMLVPNSVHFTEICLTSNRPERECPNRRYLFERHPRKKLKLPDADLKEVMASNRTDCEDKCLNEFSFVCRSASFNLGMRTCTLSRFTRRTHPEMLVDHADSDYLENTCLNAERRCDGLAVFIKEENKRLGGPFEVDLFTNLTLEECQTMCVHAEKYFCRSIEYDEMTKLCTLSEEDSISQKEDIGIASSPSHNFYDFACLDSPRGSEYPDNSVTSHLFTGKKPDTAFQRYRNSRLGGEHHSEISGRSLSECLDECLRQPSFQCKSAEYSERHRICRLTKYSQKDGMRIIYDADYDYYENLMLGGDETQRPGDNYPGDRFPGGGDRYPPGGDRYPPGGDRYPPGGDRYPPGGDRYPPGGDRYPGGSNRYPGGSNRYPGGIDKYPGGIDKYPGGGDKYPSDRYPGDYRPGGSRYPPERYPPERYPPGSRFPPGGGRYPPGGGRYPPGGGRYPSEGSRYPYRPGGDLYPDSDDRYPPKPIDSYPDGNRYPIGPDDRYPAKYPPGYKERYPYYPPSSGGRYPPGDDAYGNRYGGPYGDFTGRYGESDYNGGSRYGNKYGNRYGDKYGDPYGDKYNNRYGDPYRNRYDDKYGDKDRNRYGDKYGDPYGDKYGNRYGDKYGSSYYGDEKDGGSRWFFRPGGRPGRPVDGKPLEIGRPYYDGKPIENGRPYYDGKPLDNSRPYYDNKPPRRPISPGPDGPIYDTFGGIGPNRPFVSRCDDGDNYKQIGTKQRLRREFVKKFMNAPSLVQCQRECSDMLDFNCRSFNYREGASSLVDENCELSDRDSREFDISNRRFFETAGNFDFYERSISRQGIDGDCLDVSQICNEDGMEFTLRTPEGFYGRIYTYGFYDRCFFRGNGGTVNVLRISGAQGYPECGTQRYGDTMTNIVVVQFSDYVQTGKDKRFNLTCLFRGPGEAVVSSGFIGAGSGSPIPIEYLPAENTLSSKVRLMILYQGRPTTTIAVGDPLTFRLEAQEGYNYVTDIFATNVVARDPYSGRSVQLIDRVGCPVDSFVFPELDRGRSGDSLEARFNAFKIPESNFLVFEATVRTCRDGCQPAYCPSGSGRSEPSFGRRRRRSVNETEILLISESNNTISQEEGSGDGGSSSNETAISFPETSVIPKLENENTEKEPEDPEYVREMIEVFDSREELQQEARRAEPAPETVCLSPGEYHGLITAVFALVAILLTISLVAGLAYRKYWFVMRKNILADRSSSMSSSYPATRSSGVSSGISIFGTGIQKQFIGFGRSRNFPGLPKHDVECPGAAPGGPFEDPSEPIYTDPSLFERSRSLRSIAVSPKRRKSLDHE